MAWVKSMETLTSGLACISAAKRLGWRPVDHPGHGRRQWVACLCAEVGGFLELEIFFLLHSCLTWDFSADVLLFLVFFFF